MDQKNSSRNWIRVGSTLIATIITIAAVTGCTHIVTMVHGGARRPAIDMQQWLGSFSRCLKPLS